jgi:predicted acetyltransferase
MHDDTIELRQPADDPAALRAFVTPAAAAFADALDDAELAADRPNWEVDRFIGAVDGERWVAASAAYSFRMTVPGGAAVGAAGITGVGVSPSHRRRGILTRMMAWLLDQANERGEPLAILHASEGAIYPHFGFGLGTLSGSFEVESGAFRFARPAEPLGRVRLVEPDEAMDVIPALYDELCPTIPGAVSRSPAKWRTQLLAQGGHHAPAGPKYLAILDVGAEPRGYALYRVKNDWDERGPKNVLTVIEVSALDLAAERALWEWLAGIDLVRRMKAWRRPVPDPLFLQLADMNRLGFTVGHGLWVRLIDLPTALEARSYDGSGDVTFEVSDTFRPANAGRWRLEVTGGKGTVTATTDPPTLALDTSDLATTYLGGFTFANLARAGRVLECREGAVADADRLFTTAVVPWCSTGF